MGRRLGRAASRPWRRRGGVLYRPSRRTSPWVIDAGEDAPLTPRDGRFIAGFFLTLILLSVVLAVVARAVLG